MAAANDLAKMVPGFEFLQGLVSSASASMPVMGQWIAPTLDPAELAKRIAELRTVQFWLEQNARLLETTIQALEVQRMTLATLQTMNLPLGELTEALKIRTPPAPPPAPAAAEAVAPAAAGSIDPMHWWGALTKQFAEIASQALRDSAGAGAAPAAAAPAEPASAEGGRGVAPRKRAR
jgi:hypothetical protein